MAKPRQKRNKEKQAAYFRQYYLKNYDRLIVQSRARTTARQQHNKKIVFEHYSGTPAQCQCCGYTGLRFLSIDHINGGGEKHRREIGEGKNVHSWLIKNNFPEGFQVLCFNCNMAKRNKPLCPHQIAGGSLD